VKVLVCGGRTFEEWKRLATELGQMHAAEPIGLIVTGAAPGADRLAERWAMHHKVPVANFPANWRFMGKAAGPARNRWMLRFMTPDVVVAFPGGAGTANMVRLATEAGVRVVDLRS
jgi:predicted Rossmann-fold nucleotide-binding protein